MFEKSVLARERGNRPILLPLPDHHSLKARIDGRRVDQQRTSATDLYTVLYAKNVSKSIRVEEDTHAALAALKGDEETFDELLTRLLEERRERIREGTGLWEGTDAAEKAREARTEMKRGVGNR